MRLLESWFLEGWLLLLGLRWLGCLRWPSLPISSRVIVGVFFRGGVISALLLLFLEIVAD